MPPAGMLSSTAGLSIKSAAYCVNIPMSGILSMLTHMLEGVYPHESHNSTAQHSSPSDMACKQDYQDILTRRMHETSLCHMEA